MLRTSKINYSYYDLASLYIFRKNFEDEIATYRALINEPGSIEGLAASEAELLSIEPAVLELKQPAEKRKYTVLTEKEVEILEVIYKCLPPSRQLMFNVIVRDGSEIMNKAVILPDGFVYDASVAEKQLKLVTPKGKFPAVFEGSCPTSPAITFKVVKDEKGQDIYSEIKPALYYDNVIKILQANVAYFQKVVKVEGMKALSDPELSEDRDGAIFKLSKYLEKIKKHPLLRQMMSKKMKI